MIYGSSGETISSLKGASILPPQENEHVTMNIALMSRGVRKWWQQSKKHRTLFSVLLIFVLKKQNLGKNKNISLGFYLLFNVGANG